MATNMNCNLQERLEKYTTCLVNEFEMYIEVQQVILEGETPDNAKLSNIATNSIKEVFNSAAGAVGKTLSGVKDYLMQERKLDNAGKLVKLINKYGDPDEKKAIRAMLVRVGYELFRSYEHQFMNAEKSQGGWSQAMVQLARTAVWCFMHYYKFKGHDELDEQYVLEAITLKDMPTLRAWKKFYYSDAKKFTKVMNTENHVKYDGVKIYSKVGLVYHENKNVVYYKNDSTKPEKYLFRRFFSHEKLESIKSEYEETSIGGKIGYEYKLDMGTITKERFCQEMLEKINKEDESLMENRLIENIERITTGIIENMMCKMMQQIVQSLHGAAHSTSTASSNVNETTVSSSSFICHTQKAEKIQNINQATFNEKVDLSF